MCVYTYIYMHIFMYVHTQGGLESFFVKRSLDDQCEKILLT